MNVLDNIFDEIVLNKLIEVIVKNIIHEQYWSSPGMSAITNLLIIHETCFNLFQIMHILKQLTWILPKSLAKSITYYNDSSYSVM